MSKNQSWVHRVTSYYRVAEAAYSIWIGKSLLASAVLAIAAPVILEISSGFTWAAVPRLVYSAAAIYAFFAVGILATVVTQERLSPKHKLSVKTFDFGCDLVPGLNQTEATAFDAKVYFVNVGNFPISYVINDIDFRIGNNVIADPLKNRSGQIDVGQEGTFISGRVPFHAPTKLPVEGQLTLKWTYGKYGAEKFEREVRLWVRFFCDPKSPTGVSHSWRYLPST